MSIGAQLSISAVAAARIAAERGISQDDAADIAASCTERITKSMGQDAEAQAQAADSAAIITGYLVACYAGGGPIAAGLEAARAMRAAGSIPREQLSAAADAATHGAVAANIPAELQLVAAAAAVGRATAVGHISAPQRVRIQLVRELAAQLGIDLSSNSSSGMEEERNAVKPR